MRRLIRKNVKPVHIRVHPDFFEKLERERKTMEQSKRRNFTTIELTEALAKSKVNFPKTKGVFNAIKKTKKKGRRN